MSDINISQQEADALIKIEKNVTSCKVFVFPTQINPEKIDIPLLSVDEREEFILSIRRKQLILEKQNHQLRVRKSIILLRLDINGPTHTNPDGTIISGSHLHIYREGFGDKWAYDIPAEKFNNLSDVYQTAMDFMDYCNINKKPNFQKDLFV